MDLFHFIKQNVDIIAVIGEYTNLKKAGSLYWKARCPFHHENTPSFTVSPHKNIFYCFGCHENGDVINFIEKIEHISALQAAQHLAQRYNLEIPKEINNPQQYATAKTHYQLLHIIAQWCNDMLLKQAPALNYLKKRNITQNTISQFSIGFFPPSSKGISQLLSLISKQGFSSQDLIEAHVIFQGKNGLYSPFEDRIIFPIKDHLGQVCGFGGRIFLPHDTRVKYYNSMDSQYFKKGKLLFGFDLAKQEIHKAKSALLVEGYTDCIALYQNGFKNVVATLGTAGSAEHLQQLAKHAQTIYLLYDADEAGKQAILRLTSICWQLDLDIKVITLPTGFDPALMLEQKQELKPFIDQATDIFTFFLANKSFDFNQKSMKHKMDTVQELFDLIAQVHDSLKENILLMKTAESLQIPLEIIKKEYTNRHGTSKKSIQKEDRTTKPEQSSSSKLVIKDNLEQQIVAFIIHDPGLLSENYETLLLACLSTNALAIVQKIIDYKNQHGSIETTLIKEILSDKEVEYAQELLFTVESSNISLTFQNLMLQFQKKYWKSIVSHIKMQIMQAKKTNNLEEIQRLITVFESLKLELCKNGRL